MTAARSFSRNPYSRRLWESQEGDRRAFWTEALGEPPAVYGERVIRAEAGWLRHWDPNRSKLAAALVRGLSQCLPRSGERWLYLGAATGTTASHVADLVGRSGAVYAVELSVRPFVRLLRLADRYPNLYPILADARVPEEYLALVPPVDGIYADVAQPDQVGLARRNAELFLQEGGPLLLALKTASMGRGGTPHQYAERARSELGAWREVRPTISIEPFHRQHLFLVVESGQKLSAAAPSLGERSRRVKRRTRDRVQRRQ